jgi:hypothetical protein
VNAKAPLPMCDKEQEDAVRHFTSLILHGDDEHKRWLLDACECFVMGRDVPPPVAKQPFTTSPRTAAQQEE